LLTQLIFLSKFSHKNGKFLLEKHVVKWEKNMFFHVYIFLLRKVVDETLANSLKGNTQRRGKEGTKKKDPSLGQKSKTQSRSLRDKGTNHVPKLSLVPRSISD
jgi:hypothetical protein